MPLLRRLTTALIAGLGLIGPAGADPVIIRTPQGQHGQGWLFGAPQDGACWLAMPNHILGERQAATVTFSDGHGVGGEAGPALDIAESPEALAATGGHPDLAFAPVTTAGHLCLSGLGLPAYAYAATLPRHPILQVSDLLATSARYFDVAIKQVKVDAEGGLMIGVWPVEERSVANMSKGISGAVATVSHSTGRKPFAMILRADQVRGIALAMRFDAIKAAFAPIRRSWSRAAREHEVAANGTGYEILGFKAIVRGNDPGPSVLQRDEGCWRVAAPGGSPTVDLTIANSSAFDRIEAMEVSAGQDCVPAAQTYYLEHRSEPDAPWVYLGQCHVKSATGTYATSCRVGVSGKQQFRLRFPTDGGEIAVSRLRLSGGVVSQQ